eukprot:SAG22_NODE_572_length_9005_cov_105.428138_5_plen_47_part_00
MKRDKYLCPNPNQLPLPRCLATDSKVVSGTHPYTSRHRTAVLNLIL